MPRHLPDISARRSTLRLTPEQERFQYLIRQIEVVRQARTSWEKAVGKFRHDHSQRLQPLRATLVELSRATVIAIDGLLNDTNWSRADRVSLRQVLCATADALLAANPQDEELAALFGKHREMNFTAAKQEEMQQLKEEAEELTGFDLGDGEIMDEEDLVQRMYEQMEAREAAEESMQSEREQRRRESAEGKRNEAAAQLLRQSLRDIYRKLASAVHPDREADPARREEKNALMQQINQAYAANDLLALFELQTRIGLIDADRIGDTNPQRLKQYNKLLAQQLKDARAGALEAEMAFRVDFGLDSDSDLSPRRLNLLTQRQARAIRAEIAAQKEFLSLLSSKAVTKRWLKEQRSFR